MQVLLRIPTLDSSFSFPPYFNCKLIGTFASATCQSNLRKLLEFHGDPFVLSHDDAVVVSLGYLLSSKIDCKLHRVGILFPRRTIPVALAVLLLCYSERFRKIANEFSCRKAENPQTSHTLYLPNRPPARQGNSGLRYVIFPTERGRCRLGEMRSVA
jgi:hypothetical protein